MQNLLDIVKKNYYIYKKEKETYISKNVCNINNAQPLKFINIGHIASLVNINSNIYESYNIKSKYTNLNPKLIVLLSDIPFLHLEKFIIDETFPRYVPEYPTFLWNLQPYGTQYSNMLENGIKQVNKLKNIHDLYEKYNNNVNDAMQLFNMIKDMKYISDELNHSIIDKNNVIEELNKVFGYFNDIVLIEKYQ